VGVYDIIQYNYSHGGWASVYFIKNLPADDCNAAGGSPTDQSEYQYLDDFQITSDNAKLESIWTNFYKTINFCNTITAVENRDNVTPGMQAMIGEAKALRAMTYFDLVVMFGDVPLFTENPTNENDFHKPRTPASEVYLQIEKDLTDAIAALPVKSQRSDADKFRVSKGFAQGLLGKVYLYQQKYQEAAGILEDLILSQEYDLEPNFSDVWAATNEFGVESLFEVSYVSNSYDWGNFPWGGGNESNIEAQLQGPRDAVFDLSNCTLDVRNGWGFNLPTQEIGDLFIAEGETIRYEGTLISQSDFEATGGVIVDENGHDYEGYMRLKYVTKNSETDLNAVAELNYTVNWRILRYADVLLMAAEAYNKLGEDGKAQDELEKVRHRAGFTEEVTETGNALFERIVKERQLELAFEGQRYWDLVRWGKAQAELSNIGFVAGKHEVFPIPLNEIIANNQIDFEDQNSGY
jgi:tetratricopeptide (TPR) repeat protein